MSLYKSKLGSLKDKHIAQEEAEKKQKVEKKAKKTKKTKK